MPRVSHRHVGFCLLAHGIYLGWVGLGWVGLGWANCTVLNERGSLNGLGVPPCWRAFFLLLRQKKEAKEKATPRSVPLRGSLRYSAHRAACLNSPTAQTRQADSSRSACVAQRLSRGPKRRLHSTDERLKVHSCGQPGKRPKNEGSAASLTPAQPVTPAQAGVQVADESPPPK